MVTQKKYLDENGKFSLRKFFKKNASGWLYVLPVIAGILLFTLIPMGTSIVYALHEYNPTAVEWLGEEQLTNFGFHNFKKIFTRYANHGMFEEVMHSLFITFRYTIVSLAFSILGSYGLALFLNQKTKGIQAFRIIYYLPNLIPGVAGILLWATITDYDSGYINMILEKIGMQRYTFYNSPKTVLQTLLFTGIFGWGGGCIMWLAQMQNIPKEMYESAELDGANYLHKTLRITIPMSTAMLFYVVVTSIIGGLQTFGSVYPLTKSVQGIGNALDFIVVIIYEEAYENGELSIACALSWVLFAIIAVFTALIFKTSKWVYYGEEM